MEVKMTSNFQFKLIRNPSYTYVSIGSVKLAFHGLDLVAFTSPNGGATLYGSSAFSPVLENVASYQELQDRAFIALAEESTKRTMAVVDRRLLGKK